jgi:sugar-phosphatase
LKAVAAHLDAEAEAARMESEEVERAGEVITLPGARDLLSALPRGTWGVVTSATSDLARARLEVNDLALPEVMVTAEDVRVGKPDPEGYVLGARLLGVAPKDCVVFEDAPPGIEAALRAGTRVVGVATTFSPAHLEGADLLVRSLAAASVETATHGRLVIRIAE